MNSVLRAFALAVAAIPAAMAVAQQNLPPVKEPPSENTAEADAEPPTAATSIPVERVSLFSSGVGYFEHVGKVQGNASLQLQFKSDQINDILKSLFVEDFDGGSIGQVTYPSQDPVEKTLKSFEIDLSGYPSLPEIVGQLRGARVTVDNGTTKYTGTVIAVQTRDQHVDGRTVQAAWLDLLVDGTLRSVPFDSIRELSFEDARLKAELEQALSAIAQGRDSERKPVSIQFAGEGDRNVRIGYVIATPVWKTSYRLILPDDDAKPALQGWAIVENQTDSDWTGIDLSLVSGRPISFIQELYQPLYLPRPVVQPERYQSLRPKEYAEGMAFEEATSQDMMLQKAMPAPSAAPMMRDAAGGAAPRERANFTTGSVQSVATAADLGDLFQYVIPNVSLPRQRSAMLPIVTDEVGIDRLVIYDPTVLGNHPLHGVRLKNTTDKHLLAGPITVLAADGYAGDAQIGNVPPGQERLLSFGIDLETLVNPNSDSKESQDIISGKIVRGVLHLSRKSVFTQVYQAENKSKKDRRLLVEHYYRQGWELVDSPKPVETTDRVHRFEVDVPAGKKESLTVNEQRVHEETVGILPMDTGLIQIHSRNGRISEPVRQALAKVAQLKQVVVARQRDVAALQDKLNGLTREQDRIRENMKSVDRNSDYYNRLLKTLDTQEDTITEWREQLDGLVADGQAAQKELEDFVANLNVE